MRSSSPPSSTLEALDRARGAVRLFAMDYDGTLADGSRHPLDGAIALIAEILSAGRTAACVTARAATAVRLFIPPLERLYLSQPAAPAAYIGGGNGTILYRIDAAGVARVYNHGLDPADIRRIVDAWDRVAGHIPTDRLIAHGVHAFRNFYDDTWTGIVSDAALEIGRAFDGRLFTEDAKVTVVLPEDDAARPALLADFQQAVGEAYSVTAGDRTFCHITRRLDEDSKSAAVRAILTELGIKEHEVATFGDMPHGNDRGLLSFPYSFTNYADVTAAPPPFLLEGEDPVAAVHAAIRYLLASSAP